MQLLTSMAYPVSLLGSTYPKTRRKPGIACKEPTAARSKPYCILAMDTRQHRKIHLRFCHTVVDDIKVSDIVIIVTLDVQPSQLGIAIYQDVDKPFLKILRDFSSFSFVGPVANSPKYVPGIIVRGMLEHWSQGESWQPMLASQDA